MFGWQRACSALRHTGSRVARRPPAKGSAVALLQSGLDSAQLSEPQLHQTHLAGFTCLSKNLWNSQGWHTRSLFSLPSSCAKEYHERRLIAYSQQQLFDVVAEVDKYKEFVPWCQRSVVIDKKDPNNVYAELEVGFRMFVERYTSQVILQHPNKIISKVSDSTLFDHLDTVWEFQPGPTPTTCWLSFKTDFMFKSPLYGQVASVFFDEVVKRMMTAFEGRCNTLYGQAANKQTVTATAKTKKWRVNEWA